MESFRSPLFIICLILLLLHQLLQYTWHINIAFADAYLDNLVAMPIVLTILQAERRLLMKRSLAYQLTVLEIFLTTAYVAVVSEFLFPRLSSRFTFDWWDLFCYFAGAGIYMFISSPWLVFCKSMKKQQPIIKTKII